MRTPLSKRAPIEVIDNRKLLDNLYWEKFSFDFKCSENYQTYNEYFYFYEAVRDVLNIEHRNEDGLDQANLVTGLQYQYTQRKADSKYVIQLKKDSEQIELSIADILVNFYENGVGVFTFQLYNNSYTDFETILKINDYGRRVCPQFLGTYEPYNDAAKGIFMADSISIINTPSAQGLEIYEDFSYYNNIENIKKAPFKIPNFIQHLIGDNFTADPSNQQAQIYLEPILDDRMFVQSFFVNSTLLEVLKDFQDKEYAYQSSDDWYKYIYVDVGSVSCKSKLLLKEQLTAATYDRWIEDTHDGKLNGQLYGVCRYAFVVLVADGWFTKNIISTHFQHIYFELTLLCLLQRAYLINFQNEVSRIAKLLEEDQSNLKRLKKDISKLYLLYIKYTNRIYFREVTPQEQGIELYDLLQQQMHLKEDLELLGKEIQELNTYVETYEQSYLSKMATLFLPLGLLAGLLGINTINESMFNNLGWTKTLLEIISVILFVVSIGVTLYLLFIYLKTKLKR